MSEARLAWTQPRTAADNRSRGRAVMRGAERRVTDQRMVRIDQARDRVYAGDLERRFLLERRQDAWQPTGEHRLADSGRTAEEHVVPTRGGEVERRSARPTVARDELGRVGLAPEIGDRLREMAHADGLEPRERCFGGRVVRADDPSDTGPSCAFGDAEDTADPTQLPVERELSARDVLREAFARDLSRCSAQRKGDREVETGALLLQLRRRKVDHALARPPQRRGLDRGPDTMLRFLAGSVDETDERERRDRVLDVGLDLDAARLEAD